MDFYTDFATHYERVFPFRPATLEFLRARLPGRGRVLDLGCGPGHYTGALAGQGLEAVGVDLDEAMIASARLRYPAGLFVAADITEAPELVEAADGAFCIGNVLPHLPPSARDRFLGDLAAQLRPEARWIVQTVNFDRLVPLSAPHEFPDLDAGGGLTFRRRYEPAADGAIRFLTRLVRDGADVFRGEATLWPCRSDELTDVHGRAGFSLEERFGGFAGEAWDAGASGGTIQVYRR